MEGADKKADAAAGKKVEMTPEEKKAQRDLRNKEKAAKKAEAAAKKKAAAAAAGDDDAGQEEKKEKAPKQEKKKAKPDPIQTGDQAAPDASKKKQGKGQNDQSMQAAGKSVSIE